MASLELRQLELMNRYKVVHVLLLLGAFCNQARSGTFVAFGPDKFVRGTGDPVVETRRFSVLEPNTPYTLRIENAGVSSAVVMLNGIAVAEPRDFQQRITLITKTVSLLRSNQLTVEVRSSPGSSLTIHITGVDEMPPVITATVSPLPNMSGWNDSNVTVTFTCSDTMSGIASCSAPITLSMEGANQTVTGRATDKARNSKSMTVSVNLDKAPPLLSIVPVDGATLNTNTATIQVSYSDALSGIDLTTLVVRIDGTDTTALFSRNATSASYLASLTSTQHVVEASIQDRAGNVRTARSRFTPGPATLHLPTVPPPRTPDESRTIRDRFSWKTTVRVPVFTGQDPTLYYALIYVRDQSDLEALDELKIHWDTVPLFREERDVWVVEQADPAAGQTRRTTPVFDGEGGFVYAVVPGLTFNLLREAALCSNPEEAEEVFPVVQLREIPVAEARNRDGSVSYEFLATEGFQYRGLPDCVDGDPNDPETVCAAESEALRLLAQDIPNVCSSSGTSNKLAQRSLFGLGKKFKRFAAKVVGITSAVADQARRGLSRLARLFKGSVTLAVTLETRNTDPLFGGGNTAMRRAWGAKRGDKVALSGVQLRVYQNLTYRFRLKLPSLKIPGTDFRTPNIIADTGKRTFPVDGLATARANDDGVAQIRVVKNSRARVCVRAENEAARITNWIFPEEACAFEVCDSLGMCADRIAASQLNSDGAFTARFFDEHINILAQTTEGRAYLQDVAQQYRPKKAEVLVGPFADLIAQPDSRGDDRAFAPCFGFPNWRNPYGAVLGAIGQFLGKQAGNEAIGPILRRGAGLAAEALEEFGVADELWTAARQAATGTAAAAAVSAAADAVKPAKDAALAAAQAAAAAAQGGDNVTEAAKQLRNAQQRGASQTVIDAAGAALTQAVADANAAAVRARDAHVAAAAVATNAARLVDGAVQAATGTSAAASAFAAATASRAAAGLLQATVEILARGISIGLQLAGRTAGELLGLVLTDFIDAVMADVDLVIPSGPSRQSRGVTSHEYGHFVLCDMMYRTNPFKFGSAWTDIIVDTIVPQLFRTDPTGEDAYINEAFADFFAAQIAGGTNYFTPDGSVADHMNWCVTEKGRCIEDNFSAGIGPVIPGTDKPKQTSPNPDRLFIKQIARIATILHDAFDGAPNTAGAWTYVGGEFVEPVKPLGSLDQPGVLNEESIQLDGGGLFRTLRAWLDREDALAHLSEIPFLGGLTQVMMDAGYKRHEICRMYVLHKQSDDCPPPPVGPPLIIE